ncbi:hypothetical protein CVT24_009224 [Panaeolus cyanescens]|uniref:Uncharacterized protein n=1 Tax=Panaeolus cyanescens TaxID=181874 RepID=A0A409Y8Q6_9AGAR|nr:hypothetical protein CVT24_009224 [Panaeolus cyanescens]
MDTDEIPVSTLGARKSAQTARRVFASQLDSDSATDDSGDNTRSYKTKKRKRKLKTSSKDKLKDKPDVSQSISAAPKPSKSASRNESTSSRPKSAFNYSKPSEHQGQELLESATPRPRPRPKPIVKKKDPTPQPQPAIVDDDDLSDLTSLGSSRDSRSLSRDSSVVIVDATFPPEFQPMPGPSSKCDNTSAQRNSSSWSLDTLGSYVWVLLDPSTKLVFNPEDCKEDLRDRLWWPGKIKSSCTTDIPLKVQLYGSGFNVVDIHSPCESNILPKLNDLGVTRFQVPTFHSIGRSSLEDAGLLASPRKKAKDNSHERKKEWENKWENAVRKMLDDITAEADSDELPEAAAAFDFSVIPLYRTFSSISNIGNTISSQGASARSGKGKRKRNEGRSSTEEDDFCHTEDDREVWKPPPVDDDLSVPGELVLAREKNSQSADYWPAKLIAYVPPKRKTEQPKYTTLWLDGTVKDIPRSWFYTMYQTEYGTCKLGTFVSEVVEVHNDHDDDQADSLGLREPSPSPVPDNPAPPKDLFCQLSIREQFAYTKGVLLLILKNEYLPTQKRHQMFIQGGKDRKAVTNNSILRGSMDPRDVEKLQFYVRHWCLRDGGRKAADDQEETDSPLIASEAPIIPTTSNNEQRLMDSKPKDNSVTSVEIDSTPIKEAPPPRDPDGDGLDENMLDPGSPAVTEPVPISSPVQPPSSSILIGLERDDSFISDSPFATAMTSDHVSIADTSVPPPSEQVDDLSDDLSDLTDLEENHTSVWKAPLDNRLTGSPDYEALSPIAKVDVRTIPTNNLVIHAETHLVKYCMNIILPEAIRQILLWRTGHRSSVEPLSPREEQELYDKGQKLLEERDWVGDVLRYRKLMEQGNERKKGKISNSQQTASTSGSSRRRRQ